jgi:uncharacterized protein (DUF302 family)
MDWRYCRRAVACVGLLYLLATDASAAPTGIPDATVIPTPLSFAALVERVEAAAQKNGLGVVAKASASGGAAARGVKIPGNAVIMVFRNDIVVRLLGANVSAGIEAPLRLYVTENPDGSACLSYRRPSAVFSPYSGDQVKAVAAELDRIFEAIAADVRTR